MSTFLRLASLGTLMAGLQLVIPEKSTATLINNQIREFSSSAESNQILPLNNKYSPPNNGGPKNGNQGSGTR
ncbi:hypothetical protein [Floridanema evergladense]|uniref:Uncharacterized protein n=1 Tax=Floridaenema evergladense BLCC-F167 TaxID=3153639 RepID=A0ABV4WHC0_9CYAN